MNSRFDLNRIIDIDKWHMLQDSLSLVTKMAIITVDYKGVPVTKHSHCQSFCQAVRQDDALSSYCQKCDARGGLEAVRSNKPYVYQCHFGIVDIAIPIIVDNQYIGAIMAGQIKLRDTDMPLEQIVTRPPNAETDRKFKALESEYRSLPVLSYEEVSTIAEMLFHLCNYIVEEAIHKNSTIDMYKKTLSLEHATAASMSGAAPTYDHIQAMQNELSSTLIETKIKKSKANEYRSVNPLLQPAFDYLYRHKHENVHLQDLASLCHVSSSYFSRVFTRETGENFSVFVPRLKIEWAKQLLETTDLSVNQISDELGFADPGYFIKTFKKFESLTPAVYRKIYYTEHAQQV
ncbi:PocR ligand-binding domain-containing protein [Paenibacillus dokdonensis]|uniref:PocR ligand-binding domain-containing protein n=1 Tax=Paenibacillus dokdonensis TaxID=2567944 RepID=A0ABU6GND6_9BACL|nr:PocR ligand-binding domain-containing protein [Paenibacillus dokdonensis]MEC0240943.1 PocR ligand-binding domain-containing protein [Paenibacillus dokdonensis]